MQHHRIGPIGATGEERRGHIVLGDLVELYKVGQVILHIIQDHPKDRAPICSGHCRSRGKIMTLSLQILKMGNWQYPLHIRDLEIPHYYT